MARKVMDKPNGNASHTQIRPDFQLLGTEKLTDVDGAASQLYYFQVEYLKGEEGKRGVGTGLLTLLPCRGWQCLH